MSEQNFSNHRKFSPIFHFVTIPITLHALLISLILHFRNGCNLESIFPVLISVCVLLIAIIARIYALKNQDRIIRLEENLRMLRLSGKEYDSQMKLSQIIALRFASDDEVVALAQKALNENLSSTDIKKQIKNWRADNNRI